MFSPPSIHRAIKTRNRKLQSGTIISITTIAHPPHPFPKKPRTIALIELEDGSRVLGQLATCYPAGHCLFIGYRVLPRMILSHVTPQGLRVYEIAYELAVEKHAETFDESVFPRYILAITGPSGVGKSTVSTLLEKVCSRSMQRVPILTTREPKHGDDGEYYYVSNKEFMLLGKQGKLATCAKILSKNEDRHYGYRRSDIEAIWKNGRIPVVVTEMHLLEGLAKSFGRRAILSFGLLPPGKSRRAMLSNLLFRLRKRGRETDIQIHERLKNAVKELKFFKERAELFDHILVNEDIDILHKKIAFFARRNA
ncbi:hypothetical protein A3D11_03110 [Candidatus Peribacteria bacterium RIFCSPHIGHO2_02_FULL_49_16]|nr:MAG: hypothetical protein A2880_01450 [Candidatus Peribacteria bacterium RIFCSPHIGHO2_01_FULL_49_38]OGJ58572.1 MAG: hypothetical protein A3D11_03110 [Candidatus Peribacteria bacterium RIFCSPHIGHO2_02_FULL_49_16]